MIPEIAKRPLGYKITPIENTASHLLLYLTQVQELEISEQQIRKIISLISEKVDILNI